VAELAKGRGGVSSRRRFPRQKDQRSSRTRPRPDSPGGLRLQRRCHVRHRRGRAAI